MQTDELKKKIQVINLPEVNSSLPGTILEKKIKPSTLIYHLMARALFVGQII